MVAVQAAAAAHLSGWPRALHRIRGIQGNKHELHAISPKKAWGGGGGRESSKSKCMHARARAARAPGKFFQRRT
eukprot:COSAG05_NODE_9_length_39734_cov_180.598067_13_plen_74_part_00